jgi:hypothetical protein
LSLSILILGAAGFVAVSGWLSVQFFLDPKSVAWLNQYLPEKARIPYSTWDDPKTISEIQAELRKSGLTAGDPIRVERKSKDKKPLFDLLLPVLRPQKEGEDRLEEIRVYRNVLNPTPVKKEALQFVNVLDAKGLDETFVLDPLANAKVTVQGGDRTLPFVKIEKFDDRLPAPGIWLNISGEVQQGDATVAYGKVVYYNPGSTYINDLLKWTSPNGKTPIWQKPPKNRPLEFVVDRSVGLEPDFQVSQLKTRKAKTSPFGLEPISLEKPAINSGAFEDALFLARNGLWAPALEVMQSVRKQFVNAGTWTLTAQAQLDLVERHAKITKAQADEPSANVSQQILANMIDGRWAKATQIARTSVADREEILDLLKFDSGRIQKRITAALKLNPGREDVQTWAALRITAKQGRANAIAWLRQQPQETGSSHPQILKLLNQIDGAEVTTEITIPKSTQKKADANKDKKS